MNSVSDVDSEESRSIDSSGSKTKEQRKFEKGKFYSLFTSIDIKIGAFGRMGTMKIIDEQKVTMERPSSSLTKRGTFQNTESSVDSNLLKSLFEKQNLCKIKFQLNIN